MGGFRGSYRYLRYVSADPVTASVLLPVQGREENSGQDLGNLIQV